jgi:hypothetical protein
VGEVKSDLVWLWKNLGKKDRLKTVFFSRRTASNVMAPFPTAKNFVSSPKVGAACQQPHVHPLVVLCFSVSHPPTTVNTYFVSILMKSRFKRRRSSKAVLDAYYQRPPGGRRANAGFVFNRRSPDTHYLRPRTSKPTSCTEFYVAQIKSISPVSFNFVNFVFRIIRTILEYEPTEAPWTIWT